MVAADYLIVGAGLTGAVIARCLADAGREILVVERRAHPGGNVHDHVHPSGIRVHTYGPHYFRTDSDAIWAFVNRFADFVPFEARVQTCVGGHLEPWPISRTRALELAGFGWRPEHTGVAASFEEECLARMPQAIYVRFVKGYTEKQWGVPATALDAQLAERLRVGVDDDPRLVTHRHQALPVAGYAACFERLLAGVPLLLNTDYLAERTHFAARRLLIYSGPIDEYFGWELGKLEYRGQVRSHYYYPDQAYVLPCVQVNYPDPADGPHVRRIEWKHLLPAEQAATIRGTVVTTETPVTPATPDGFEYPVPSDRNRRLYAAYRERVSHNPRVLICGRLGEYRYYDMDHAIARATALAHRILAND